jgi:hypothetical protein
MPPSSARKPGGFAALYEVQEKLRIEREQREQQNKLIEAVEAREISETPSISLPTEPDKQLSTGTRGNNSRTAATRQLSQSSQLPTSSQLDQGVAASSESWQLRQSSHLPQSNHGFAKRSSQVDMLAGLPDVKGHLRLPNQVTDYLLPMLDPFEQATYIQLYRLSWGFNKPSCYISLPKLSERTKIPVSTLKKVIARLQTKGLIEKVSMTIGYGKEQGIEYRVLAPSSQPSASSQLSQSSQLPVSYNKRKEHIKTHTQEQPERPQETETTERVCVGSKFSMEECLRYSKNLQTAGQGITNPGGYATTIRRTGEADDLIEKFLNPPQVTKQDNASECPDCAGTGWWYPKGKEQGIAKCKHERLAILAE